MSKKDNGRKTNNNLLRHIENDRQFIYNKKLKLDDLRKRAEKSLKEKTVKKSSIPEKVDTEKLTYELDVYHTELEMQNEELRLSQILLEESRNKYFELYDFAPIAYITTDEKGMIEEANLAGAKMLNKDRYSLVGMGFVTFVASDYRKTYFDHLEKTIDSKQKQECELRLKINEDEFLFALLESIIEDASEEKNPLIRMAIIDISYQKIAEEDKNNFIAIMSHELRNPLTPILAGAQLILTQFEKKYYDKTKKQDKDLYESVNIIEQQAQNLSLLLNDLLDVARINSGHIELKKEPVDLKKAIKTTVKNLQPLLNKQKHNLSISLPSSPLKINADPIRLEQILINILNNAIKFTAPGGQINISAKHSLGNYVEIIIKDNGIGIEPSRIDKVFDFFTHVGTPFVSTHGELGVGLILSKNLVTMHNGSITAKSNGKNEGSEFMILLPSISENLKLDLNTEKEEAKPVKNLRILTVDDNENIVKLFGKIINFLGHECKTVTSGKSAIQLVEKFNPHIMFIDIGMPEMDGYELVKELRQIEKKSKHKFKIVAVTGYGQEEDKKKALSEGFDLHLTKPVDMKLIENTINKIVK